MSTHGNTNATFQATSNHDPNAENFAYTCAACHEPHGLTDAGGGDYNIFMVKPTVGVGTSYTTVPGGAGSATPGNGFVPGTEKSPYVTGGAMTLVP